MIKPSNSCSKNTAPPPEVFSFCFTSRVSRPSASTRLASTSIPRELRAEDAGSRSRAEKGASTCTTGDTSTTTAACAEISVAQSARSPHTLATTVILQREEQAAGVVVLCTRACSGGVGGDTRSSTPRLRFERRVFAYKPQGLRRSRQAASCIPIGMAIVHPSCITKGTSAEVPWSTWGPGMRA